MSNQTLNIQPGVTVIIGPNVYLNVNGGITAIGTPALPITIRGATPTNFWQSISILDSVFTNRFHYCRISDADNAILMAIRGGNRVMSAEIFNCDFQNCRGVAWNGNASGYGNPGSTYLGSAVLAPEIHNCVFDGTGNGISFQAVSDGLDPLLAAVNARITGNVFKNLKFAAFVIYSGGADDSRPVFVNNTVLNANQGVIVQDPYTDVSIRNNLFINVTNAVSRVSNGTNSLDASYNCFFNGQQNFSGYPGIYGIPILNNHNGDPCDAFNNIFLDPLLFYTNRLLLSSSSPCIDAGDPAISDLCFLFSHGSAISDIGAYGGPDACNWLNHGFAPVIKGVLDDQSSCVGESVTFKVQAEGTDPLTYRWYFDGTNLLTGETNAELKLINLETNQSGLYSVSISNLYGNVTNPPARLLVSDACVGINLYAGLSITGVVGRTYAIESSTNLGATNWTLLATNLFSTPRYLFIDTNTPFIPGNFFRVRLQP